MNKTIKALTDYMSLQRIVLPFVNIVVFFFPYVIYFPYESSAEVFLFLFAIFYLIFFFFSHDVELGPTGR